MCEELEIAKVRVNNRVSAIMTKHYIFRSLIDHLDNTSEICFLEIYIPIGILEQTFK